MPLFVQILDDDADAKCGRRFQQCPCPACCGLDLCLRIGAHAATTPTDTLAGDRQLLHTAAGGAQGIQQALLLWREFLETDAQAMLRRHGLAGFESLRQKIREPCRIQKIICLTAIHVSTCPECELTRIVACGFLDQFRK